MFDPLREEKEMCKEIGHEKLVFLGSSKDGSEYEYMCMACKSILTTINGELEEANKEP